MHECKGAGEVAGDWDGWARDINMRTAIGGGGSKSQGAGGLPGTAPRVSEDRRALSIQIFRDQEGKVAPPKYWASGEVELGATESKGSLTFPSLIRRLH